MYIRRVANSSYFEDSLKCLVRNSFNVLELFKVRLMDSVKYYAQYIHAFLEKSHKYQLKVFISSVVSLFDINIVSIIELLRVLYFDRGPSIENRFRNK